MSRSVLIVSGLPGAGKTTLSDRLGRDLGLVVVCRDRLQTVFTAIRSALAEGDRDLVGASGDALVTHVAASVLDAGDGVVIDNNFNWHWQIDTVRSLVDERRPRAFEVRLWGDEAELRRRWAKREPDLARLPEMSPILDSAYAKAREYVLAEDHPRVELDATDLRQLDALYPALLVQISRHRAAVEMADMEAGA